MAAIEARGLQGPPHPGRPAHRHRHHRQQGRPRRSGLREPARRARGDPGLPRLQAGLARGEERGHAWCASGGVTVGGPRLVIVAGPCAVESLEQMLTVARAVKKAGAHLLRGRRLQAAHQPLLLPGPGRGRASRSWPRRGRPPGCPIVTEAVDVKSLDLVERYADAIQIGARNMQNFSLLRRAGRARKPVLLKRGHVGHPRGVPDVRRVHPLRGQLPGDPVRARRAHLLRLLAQHPGPRGRARGEDASATCRSWWTPRHGTGPPRQGGAARRAPRPRWARTACIVEVHHDPDRALSDGPQSITPEMFEALVHDLRLIAPVIGRRL